MTNERAAIEGQGLSDRTNYWAQNLHFKQDGCELCILEWLVKYSFLYPVPVFVVSDHFGPKGNELACEPCSAHFVTV